MSAAATVELLRAGIERHGENARQVFANTRSESEENVLKTCRLITVC